MNKTIVFLLALGVTSVYAQEYKPGKIDFSIGFGFRTMDAQIGSIEQYRELFPDSDLLQGDYSTYGYPDYYFNSSTMVNLLWGIQLKQNEAFEQRLRVGVTFGGISPSYGSFYNQTSFAYDTLTSSRTGEVSYVDSVYSENLYINTTQNQVGLDLAYLIKANQNGRWSFYSGVGLEIGAILNAKANISESKYSYLSNDAGVYYPYAYDDYGSDNKTEVQQLDGGLYGLLYLPVGLDLRLSMKNAFWRRMHLYTEFRPSVSFSNSPISDNNVQLAMGLAVFGIRADF